MIGPDFKRPSVQVADDWMEAGTKTIDSGRAQYREWWSSLNDPVLSNLIDLAYEQNLTLLAAGVRVLEARAQLGVAIGEFYPQQQQLGATASYNRIPGTSGIPVAPASLAVGIPADLLRRRPDVRKAELKAAAQSAQIGLAKGALFPSFSLVGNIGTLSSDVGQSSLGSGSLGYSAGPAIQWNILNYGQITNNVRVQDAKLQGLLVDYQNSVLKAQQEVENGITEFGQSRDEAAFLQTSVVAATGAFQIALLQYKEGTVDFTVVLNAEENLYKAQNSLAVAQGNIPLGLIKAYRAMGGGWEVRDGRDFVPVATREEMATRTDWGTPDLLRPQAPGLPAPEDVGPLVRPPEW